MTTITDSSGNAIKPQDSAIVLKILVIGDAATGKTSIIRQYCMGTFSKDYKPTVGVDFLLKQLAIPSKQQIIRVQLWDIAGQDRFTAINRTYYREAVGAMIVFDVTKPKSFESVAKWKAELDDKVKMPDGSPIPVILLGNKSDMETAEPDRDQIAVYINEHGFIDQIDTSAKLNLNIDKAVLTLVDKILENSSVIVAQAALRSNYQPGLLPKKNTGSRCC